METLPDTKSPHGRQALRDRLLATRDEFVAQMPKVELHVHIEGTLTPELRWTMARRNGVAVRLAGDHKHPRALASLAEVEQAYGAVISSAQLPAYAHRPPGEVPATFFEAYYSGIGVLRTRQDYFDLASAYFARAAAMQVRYCEVFFDPQAHTARGVAWADFMGGLRAAQQKAAAELNVRSGWIMCFLRDMSPESALQHYHEAMAYRDMIIGFGLDSDETGRPPILFEDVFARARADGFRITAHCDVGQRDTYENIRQVAAVLGGGTGADRVDHGLNAADRPALRGLVARPGRGLTLCPWAYLRRWTYAEVAGRLRTLLREPGVRVCVASDSPAYMDGSWVLHNLLLAKAMARLSDADVLALMKTSVEMSWAADEEKARLLDELAGFGARLS